MDENDDTLEDCSEGGELGRVKPRGESQVSCPLLQYGLTASNRMRKGDLL